MTFIKTGIEFRFNSSKCFSQCSRASIATWSMLTTLSFALAGALGALGALNARVRNERYAKPIEWTWTNQKMRQWYEKPIK